MAKLVDARDLKSLDFGCAGSTPAGRTIPCYIIHIKVFALANGLFSQLSGRFILHRADCCQEARLAGAFFVSGRGSTID